MKYNLIIASAIICVLSGSFTFQKSEQNSGNLHVEVNGLKNKKGQIGILVFENSDGFPSDNEKALKQVMIPIAGELIQHTFENLPFGEYAVAAMHDENQNAKLDTNFIGIPKEGTGVSNNITSKMSAPKFKDARFTFEQSNVTTTIKLNY